MQYHLTKEGLEKLKKELENLKKNGRQEISERLKRAKEYGDLSENSEYSDAKEAQSILEERIFKLEQMIRNMVLIKKSGQKEKISIGSTIEIEKSGKIFKYTIVGSKEAKPEENLISNESPLGKAFIERKIGENVEIETPKGKVKYKIISID